jgi:hypothetical protein
MALVSRLSLDSALNGVNGATNLCQHAIPGGVEDPAVMLGHQAV